jgi:glycosyltransferase involved in cell wall biosynthesis
MTSLPKKLPEPWVAAQVEQAISESRRTDLRIAIVHDQLYTIGGAEKVLQHICQLFPTADVYCLFNLLPPEQVTTVMGNRQPKVSFLQKLPFLSRLRKLYFILMPIAIEQLELDGYDLIISSSYLVAKGVIVTPDQTHVCYLHSPMRYAWDQQKVYLEGIPTRVGRMMARVMLHYMRFWDVRSSNGVDLFLTNSNYISRRTMKAYRRDSSVLYPPVDVHGWNSVRPPRDLQKFVTMSRVVEGKRIELLLEAFRLLPEFTLSVVGDGTARKTLEAHAPDNVHFLGRLSDEAAANEIASSSAFVYAAEEDFGITTVEAQACGTPVVAYRAGGAAEIVRDLRANPQSPTGVLFESQSPEAIAKAVRLLYRHRESFHDDVCRTNAERFSVTRFERGFLQEIDALLARRMRRSEAPIFPVERSTSSSNNNSNVGELVSSVS